MDIERVLDLTYFVLQGVIYVDEFTSRSNILEVDIENKSTSEAIQSLCKSIVNSVVSNTKVNAYIVPLNSEYYINNVEVTSKSRITTICKLNISDMYNVNSSIQDMYSVKSSQREYRIGVRIWPI